MKKTKTIRINSHLVEILPEYDTEATHAQLRALLANHYSNLGRNKPWNKSNR